MKRPTAAERRGLDEIYRLAYADVECSEPGDYTAQQRRDLDAGFVYLAELTARTHRSVA